jgi:hypothetical protein
VWAIRASGKGRNELFDRIYTSVLYSCLAAGIALGSHAAAQRRAIDYGT